MFTVPVNIPNVYLDEISKKLGEKITPPVQLCYEIHGRDGSFNIISTKYTSVNAEYRGNFIRAIGILAYDTPSAMNPSCYKIKVSDLYFF